MENDVFKCDLCSQPIKEQDEVMRCVRGKITDGYDANELHVEEVTWYHSKCFETLAQTEDSIKLKKIRDVIFSDLPYVDYPNVYYEIKRILEG